MRNWTLVTLSLLSACSFKVPRGIPVHAQGKLTVNANVRIQANTAARVDTVVVPLQNAPVVEFFGIPLADASDVLFVLDVSGSMSERAEGQLAMLPPPPPVAPIEAPPPAAPPPDAPPPAGPPPSNEPAPPGSQPPPPAAPPPGTPPPMGYPPGYPPPSSVPPAAAQPAPAPATAVATGPTKLEVAQSELIDAVSKLPPGTRVNILIFSNEVDAYAPNMVVIDDNTRRDLVSFVREMRADGATALQPAMRVSFLLNAKRVVLLSDGLGNIGGGREDIMRDVREALRGGLRIDAIGIGRGQDRRLLSQLAEETGGLYQAL